MLLSPLPPTTTTALPRFHQHPHPHLHPIRIPPPPSFPRPEASPVSSALQSTCRELQSLISSTHHHSSRPPSPYPIPSNIAVTATLQSPIEFVPKRNPLRMHRANNHRTGKVTKKPLYTKATAKNLSSRATNKALKPTFISIPSSTMALERLGKENAAPMTPTGQQQSNAPLVLPLGLGREDFEGLEESWKGFGDRGKKDNDAVSVGEERKRELSRYDEAVVGLLLKQLRLRGLEGRRGRAGEGS